jgi:hypothetical protein
VAPEYLLRKKNVVHGVGNKGIDVSFNFHICSLHQYDFLSKIYCPIMLKPTLPPQFRKKEPAFIARRLADYSG